MDAIIRKLGSVSADEREVEDKFVVIKTIATTNVLSIIITLTFKRHLKCKEATDQHRQIFNCLDIPDFMSIV